MNYCFTLRDYQRHKQLIFCTWNKWIMQSSSQYKWLNSWQRQEELLEGDPLVWRQGVFGGTTKLGVKMSPDIWSFATSFITRLYKMFWQKRNNLLIVKIEVGNTMNRLGTCKSLTVSQCQKLEWRLFDDTNSMFCCHIGVTGNWTYSSRLFEH